MADYTERPRPRHTQRYWYLANDEVLREPTLLTTPAERRWAINDEADSFWSSELISRLDGWAEDQARDRGTSVMQALRNSSGEEGEDWVREKFLDEVDRLTGRVDPPSEFSYGTGIESKFTFANGADVVVFWVSLERHYSYYSDNHYTLAWGARTTVPQVTRTAYNDDSEIPQFQTKPNVGTLEREEYEELLGEAWGEARAESVKYDENEYVEAAAGFCRLSMQIADFVTVGPNLTIYEAKWDPNYVHSLQEALKNEGPMERLRESLQGMRDALQDMGFEVSKIKDSDIWNLAANGGDTPVVLTVKDKKEKPHSAVIIDLPAGRIHATDQTIQPDTLTLYEMAMKRAERDGTAEELRAALALISSRAAFENHERSQAAVKTALDLLPNIPASN